MFYNARIRNSRTKEMRGSWLRQFGVSIEIDITAGATQHLKDLGHDLKTQDLTFENTRQDIEL